MATDCDDICDVIKVDPFQIRGFQFLAMDTDEEFLIALNVGSVEFRITQSPFTKNDISLFQQNVADKRIVSFMSLPFINEYRVSVLSTRLNVRRQKFKFMPRK